MNVNLHDGYIVVSGDEKFKTESAFWFALRNKLREMGHDVIKKLIYKDGHMIGSNTYPYYLRERKGKWCIWDSQYAVRFLHKQFNEQKEVVLSKEELL